MRIDLLKKKKKITIKDQPDHQLKSLTLEMLLNNYSQEEWTRIYTDGSAEGAIKNGGTGIIINNPDGRKTAK